MSTVLHDAVRLERDGALAILTIEHPPANAISRAVVLGIVEAFEQCEADGTCRALSLTGAGPKFFAAGADISEFGSNGGESIARGQDLTLRMERSRLATVCAVNGIAFGGGCELSLACDVRVASSSARFGQPEITLGIMPGMGGTQRLPRAVGKTKAMDLILTGRMMDAAEAERAGLVSRVVPAAELLAEAVKIAEKIASFSAPIVAMAKESVNRAYDMPLGEGLRFERRLFHAMFATEDQKEGMAAFAEKRPPKFRHR